MTDREFWEEVRKKWIVTMPAKVIEVNNAGKTSERKTLAESNDSELIPFELVDHDKVFDAVLAGKEIPIKQDAMETVIAEQKSTPSRPRLDNTKFDALIEKHAFADYVEACKMLRTCELPRKMDELYGDLIERLVVLDKAIEQNKAVYKADVSKFHEIYIPEVLQTTATYLEYLNIGVDGDVQKETENEIVEICSNLLSAVNVKIDEIFKQVSLEIQSQAQGLSMKMKMDGYVTT